MVGDLGSELGYPLGGVEIGIVNGCHGAMLSAPFVATFGAVNDRELQALRANWLVMPFTVGPAFAAALDDTERAVRIGLSTTLWMVWAGTLIATMVPRAQTLSVIRIVIPATPVALAWALIDAGDNLSTAAALVAGGWVAVVTALALRSTVADTFVDGSSYGDERRFLLGTPGPLLAGPIFLVWILTIVGAAAGPIALLTERWVLGGILTAIGVPVVWFGVNAIHRLSNRWLVFVPAGIVVYDKTALREPQLFRTEDLARFGPAPADADEEDLSLGALGLALRVRLTGVSKIIKNGRSIEEAVTDIDGFIISPNRPGAVMAEARERDYPIG